MWTHFWDMHSGGGQKAEWPHIYIEAGEQEARSVFYARFNHSPDRVTCTCCGEDYAVSEYETLAEATAYQRNLRSINSPEKNERGWSKETKYIEPDEDIPEGWTVSKFSHNDSNGMSLKLYTMPGNPDAHFIYAKDIKPEERSTAVPEQGYVWQD